MADHDVDGVGVFRDIRVHGALAEQGMGIVGGCRDPCVHLTILPAQVTIGVPIREAGGLSFDEAQGLKVATLEMTGEPIDRDLVGLGEAGAGAFCDLRPCRTVGEGRLDHMVDRAFDRAGYPVVDIVVEGVLIADAIDGFAVDREDIAMTFDHANLVRIVRAGEATQIELRHIMVPLGPPGGHSGVPSAGTVALTDAACASISKPSIESPTIMLMKVFASAITASASSLLLNEP